MNRRSKNQESSARIFIKYKGKETADLSTALRSVEGAWTPRHQALCHAINLRGAPLQMTALSGAWIPASEGPLVFDFAARKRQQRKGKTSFPLSCSTHVVPRLRRCKHGAPVLGDRGVQNPRLQPGMTKRGLVFHEASLISLRFLAGRNCAHEWRSSRSLGFARDDKKERVVARKRRLMNRGIFQN